MKHIEFIQLLGGVSRVAQICGITRGAVSQWKRSRIPPAQFNFLKTKFPEQYKQIYGTDHDPIIPQTT